MSRFLLITLFSIACFSCSKAKETGPSPAPTPTETAGSSTAATAGSGSAMAAGSATAAAAGSGSAMAGSGSAMAASSGSAAAGSGEAAEEHEAGGFDFDKLTTEQKMKFMKEKVVPEMKVAFQKFDKKRYARFGCKTCHGKDAKKRKYQMPNPHLPKLDFAALKAGRQKPKVAAFMSKTVEPGMAKLLNQPVHSQSHPDGFGCLECHEQKK